MMKKAYSYIRISTPEQALGDGIRRQVAKAEAWASANGYVIDRSLRDIGVSAFAGDNSATGELARFRELVSSGKVPPGSALILESFDRFSREPLLEVLPKFLELVNAGVAIVTLIDGQIYSKEALATNPNALFVGLLVMARAHEESATKSVRVGDSWAKKRLAARESGTVLTSRTPSWIRVVGARRDRRFEVDEKRALLVRRIFELIAAGNGRRSIATILNKEDPQTAFRSRKGWHASTIGKIIRSRAAIGEFHPKAGTAKAEEPITNYFPPIISEALFARANAALDARGSRSGGRRGTAVVNLLQGIARCATCGGRVGTFNKGSPPKGARYFACTDARRGVGCDNRGLWRADKVDRALVAGIRSEVLKQALGLTGDEDDLVRDLAVRIAELEARQNAILDLVERGDNRARLRYDANERELSALRRDHAAARDAAMRAAATPTFQQRAAQAAELAARLKSEDPTVIAETRRRLAQAVREVFKEVHFSPTRVYGVVALRRAERPSEDITVRPDGKHYLSVRLMSIDPEEAADALRQDAVVDDELRRRPAFPKVRRSDKG